MGEKWQNFKYPDSAKCKLLLTGCMQIISNDFFSKLVKSVSLIRRLSKNYQNLTTESGSK